MDFPGFYRCALFYPGPYIVSSSFSRKCFAVLINKKGKIVSKKAFLEDIENYWVKELGG